VGVPVSTALVTGAAGFVGRHFTAYLREAGWTVWAIDTVYAPELSDRQDAREFFSDSGFSVGFSFDLVLHCAAVVGGRQVIDTHPLAQAVNLELDAALFRWALQTRPGRVVYFSSSAVYPVHLQGVHDHRQLREDMADPKLTSLSVGVPDKLYGWAKLTGEYLAELAKAEGLAVTVVRTFSGYGEDQDPTYPFTAFVDRALRREDPFLIWGSGAQVRDFIHIDDIVAATMAMVQDADNGPANLGWGIPVSLSVLAEMICAQAGYSPEFEFARTAPAGVHWRVSAQTRRRLWSPKVTLEEGISRALQFRGPA
jgi:nucleoside-diphosphate-sugar epimerase